MSIMMVLSWTQLSNCCLKKQKYMSQRKLNWFRSCSNNMSQLLAYVTEYVVVTWLNSLHAIFVCFAFWSNKFHLLKRPKQWAPIILGMHPNKTRATQLLDDETGYFRICVYNSQVDFSSNCKLIFCTTQNKKGVNDI